MMTPVEFFFVTPEGVPISNAEVEIQLLRSAFDIEDSGVLMPRLVIATTDEDGKVVVDLWSTTTMYQVRVLDTESDAGLFYKFYVPEMDIPGTVVRLQDIVVDVEMENTSFADAVLVQVQTARVNAVAAQIAAQESAAQAAASAQGVDVFATAAAASATAAAGSATTASTAATTATTKADEATATAEGIAASVTTATTKATEASTSAANALASQNAAATSATNASTSAATATTKATEAATSASSAAGSATTATNQATIATSKASEAAISASNAAGSATAAAGSATTASTEATTATTQATAASDSATAAQTSATNAATSATSASNSKDDAAVSATTASTKASEALASATSAQTSATTATTQAGIATTKATEALTSANNAAGSATAASGSASTASTQASNAAASATAAQTSATNAAASEVSAEADAATATTQAGIATTKASEADASASTASTQAGIATTKAGEAASSATAAGSAQVAAEAARDQTLAAFDSFDDRYLGQKSVDPTVDNDGDPLVGGALYFNTNPLDSGGGMKVYDATNSSWLAAYASLSGALIAANNLSDLASASAARINLGLGDVENKSSATIRAELTSGNVTTALGFTPYNATNPTGFITSSALAPYLTSATAASTYQTILVSGTSIKTVNGQSVLGSGNIQIDGGVTSFNTRTGAVTLSSGDVTGALGFTPYNATNPDGYVAAAGARAALSFTAGSGAYNSTTGVITIPTNTNQLTNGAGFTTNTGTVTSVAGTGTVSGLSLSGSVTTSGNLTLSGTLAVTAANFASQTANTILAAPNGVAGVPTFRALVAGDIPTLNQNTTGTAANVTGTVAVANGGTGATTAAAALTALGAYAATNPAGYITSSASISGNAATATALQTARTINGVSFNGTANITILDGTKLPLAGGTMTGGLTVGGNLGLSGNSGGVRVIGPIAGTNTTLVLEGSSASGSSANIELTNDNLIFLDATQSRFRSQDASVSFLNISSGATNVITGALQQQGNQVLHAGNYTSYAPSLTGSGASGSWGISITGTAANVTGVVAVAKGGTGLTSPGQAGNILRSDGTAWTAQFVNIIGLYDDNVWESKQTFQGTTSKLGAILRNAGETITVSPNSVNSNTTIFVTSQSIIYATANATGNWNFNIRGSSETNLNDLLEVGESVTVVMLATQGATAFYNSSIQVDGGARTVRWIGGAPTAGNPDGIDVYRYVVIKTAYFTYTVLASVTQFKA